MSLKASTAGIIKKIPTSPSTSLHELIVDKDISINVPVLNSFSQLTIASSSLIKILSLIDNDVESPCCTYLTCLIETSSPSSSLYELDPVYVELLHRSKCFFISSSHHQNRSIMVSAYSIKKIATMLETDTPGLCDFISVAIFIFTSEELHERNLNMKRLSTRAIALEKKQSSMIEINDGDIVYNSSVDVSNSHNDSKVNNSNNDNSFKVYGSNQKKLLSRQRLSRSKIPSNMNSRNKEEMKEEEVVIGLPTINTSNSIEVSPMKLKGGRRPNIKKKIKSRSRPMNENGNNDMKNLYLINDIEGNCVIITEDTFDMLTTAKEEGKFKEGNGISVYDVDNKAVCIDVNSIDLIKDDEDKKMIGLTDLNGNYCVFHKKMLANAVNENTNQEYVECDDYTGCRMFLPVPSESMKKGILREENRRYKNEKKFYCIRLAKIEVNDVSNYYVN